MARRSSASAKTSGCSSKYRGVSWYKQSKNWRVSIRVGGKTKGLGYFSDEIAAARAYDEFVIAETLNKPLNFPDDTAAAKRHTVTSSTASLFRGVCRAKPSGGKRWQFQVTLGRRKKKYTGCFSSEISAARAYDAFVIARKLSKPLNFPVEDDDDDDDDDDDEVAGDAAAAADDPRVRVRRTGYASRFRGVSWHKQSKKWRVHMYIIRGVRKYIAKYADEVEAAHAYDAYAIANNIVTPLNFPEKKVAGVAPRGRAAPIKNKKRKKAGEVAKSSRFRGVSWDKMKRTWKVSVCFGGKNKHLGYFSDQFAAAHAFDTFVVAKKLKRPLNFRDVAEAIGCVVTSSKASRRSGEEAAAAAAHNARGRTSKYCGVSELSQTSLGEKVC